MAASRVLNMRGLCMRECSNLWQALSLGQCHCGRCGNGYMQLVSSYARGTPPHIVMKRPAWQAKVRL
jgi:hypothetical protein